MTPAISAQAACKIALKHSDRLLEEQVKEIYNKIYTTASDGYFTIQVYSDEISVKCMSSDIKKILAAIQHDIETLEGRGYKVTIHMNPTSKGYGVAVDEIIDKTDTLLDEWVLIIDWSDCYKEDK